MKELYILWCILMSFAMISANSKGEGFLSFSCSNSAFYNHSSGSHHSDYRPYGRGWGWGTGGGGGGYHK